MEQQLYEFPVLIEETNEIITLFLSQEDMEKASQESAFLMNLVAKEGTINNTINNAVNNNVNNTVNKNNNIEPEAELEDANETADKNNADKLTTFVWPDKAVYLLIEIYREKEEEFTNGFKRSNKIWTEIAAQMNEANPASLPKMVD